ncbi:PP2C family protein-serine/threonine phosphatase [Pseudomonas aeruginosa]|uniref:PP2C family protein-serine/threonine phosphatase n=1 Tax=Pseudomonas aeruginosa TaxID=287 RepID=UPI000F5431A3|nr:PP2C family serine/threonine-protein phosphatase [Pseudomonas aeruginosa]MDI4080829.1 serine/threonine-protein phosphatase [Pseudomonas aeruginosa]MDI4136147.1 serine/threonine-protein phosphatase [Pseudomonas aeruginosa]MDI4224306.1 serine/threonine-protein phosphatase [Pseudomonas aeruginosa]MDI4230722.1 serine/threonine-protein phosphatase [Pseudomonas aeruginosa]RPW90091.1 hypothetical protein IPC736_07025 [Pseudomonas aeruginosa]
MTSERYTVESFSFPGRSKPNQDAVLVKEYGEGALALGIADGMGGKPGGNFASRIAIRTIEDELSRNPETSIEDIFSKVKTKLVTESRLNPEFGEMATTLSVCLINNGVATIGHVGDCRVYHLRGNGIATRTKDQTEVQRLLDDGILPRHMAKDYPRRNILLSVMNATLDYSLQTDSFNIKPRDRIILMSDGAYSLLSKAEIRDLSVNSESESSLASGVLELIRMRPIRDDYSAILCRLN